MSETENESLGEPADTGKPGDHDDVDVTGTQPEDETAPGAKQPDQPE